MALRQRAKERLERRLRRHRLGRKRVSGTAERPRLVVHRSSKHMRGQIVDDQARRVLVGASTLAPELRAQREDPTVTKTELARAAGRLLAERARAAGIRRVVFDRGGFLYHGRVAAFAEGAREGGLEF